MVYDRLRAKGLSQRACLHVHRVMHTAFADGVRRKKLKENVVNQLKAPQVEGRELAPITYDQMRGLIRAARGTRLAVPVALTAVTGLRRGELLALRWRNVRLDKEGSVYVAEALEQTRRLGIRFKSPKAKSKRVIPLSPEAIAMLAAYKAEQDDQKQHAGAVYVDNDLVFGTQMARHGRQTRSASSSAPSRRSPDSTAFDFTISGTHLQRSRSRTGDPSKRCSCLWDTAPRTRPSHSMLIQFMG